MSEEHTRKFIHDSASPIFVCKMVIKSLQDDLLKAESSDEQKTRTLKNIEKLQRAFSKIEELHAEFKKISDSVKKAA